MKSYSEFVKTKKLLFTPVGFQYEGDTNHALFPFQRDVVLWALKRGRACLFEDCGLGKTIQQLEWARIVSEYNDAPVLIVTPLGVALQTNMIEAPKFGIETNICNSGADLKSGINITNYEKLHKFENVVKELSGVVLDESSILKNMAGKTRNQIITMFERTPYRLACSATPAPNDFMELGNHSEFLGIMSYSEMLSMFFVNDSGDTGQWRLKKHASEAEFWKWLASWAIMLTNPTDIGYSGSDDFVLPELIYHEHKIHAKSFSGGLMAMEARTMQERRQVRKETILERCKKAADIINATNDQWVVWCGLNPEGDLLAKMIKDCHQISGSTDNDTREKLLLGFADGSIKRLVTKASISGFGLNWQHCHKMAFVGLSDSWEQLYQATRRVWRFGQKNVVDAHIIIEEREGAVLKNIKRKDRQAKHMAKNMIKHMTDLVKSEIRNAVEKLKPELPKIKMEIPKWIPTK